MNFAKAFECVLDGKKVRREDWNRPYYVSLSSYLLNGAVTETVMIAMKDGRINAYTPSQCDMLAGDWVRVYNDT